MDLQRSAALSFGIVASILLGMGTTLYVFVFRDAQLGAWPTLSILLFLVLALLAKGLLERWNFIVGFLVGLGSFLFAWRVAGQLGIYTIAYPLLPGFVFYVMQFVAAARHNLRAVHGADRMPESAWGLTFIRLYVGFDLVPHATEKLFVGAASHQAAVSSFASLGVSNPDLVVWIGGLCEFAIVIGLGLGFLSRIGAVGAALYFLIATIIGGHFAAGFIWDGPGWEYSALMISVFLCFAVVGPGRFSVDGVLFGQRRVFGVRIA